ncbi:MAG: terminase [Chloroflexota bacterium]
MSRASAVAAVVQAPPEPPPLCEAVPNPDGRTATLRWNLHPGQIRAWQSTKRVTLVCAGSQGGKTSFGPFWLLCQMQRRGPGDYLVATPTFPLLELKLLPEVKRLFCTLLDIGEYVGSPSRRIVISDAGFQRLWGRERRPDEDAPRILFGYAADPDSLESATAKAAWLDEAGQRLFKAASFDAIERRLALAQGPILITTTPYDLGWLKVRLWDKWAAAQAAGRPDDCDVEVINFPSTMNPRYPREEAERLKRELPAWKYEQFVLGRFSRPAGLIYEKFDSQIHVLPRFAIPTEWPRYLGVDFGEVNTAAVKVALEPSSGRKFVYGAYHAGGVEVRAHALALLGGESQVPTAVGGARSEEDWRAEWRAAGIPMLAPPIADVELGISRVNAAFARSDLYVLADVEDLIADLGAYSRVVDDDGNPTEEIEDKSTWHRLDALRYVVAHLDHARGADMAAVRARSRFGGRDEEKPSLIRESRRAYWDQQRRLAEVAQAGRPSRQEAARGIQPVTLSGQPIGQSALAIVEAARERLAAQTANGGRRG